MSDKQYVVGHVSFGPTQSLRLPSDLMPVNGVGGEGASDKDRRLEDEFASLSPELRDAALAFIGRVRLKPGMSLSEILAGTDCDTLRHRAEEVERQRHEAQTLLTRYKRALEGLTPGGSEFVNDPERCVRWVEDRADGEHKAFLHAMAERNEAQAAAAGMRNALLIAEGPLATACFESESYERLRKQALATVAKARALDAGRAYQERMQKLRDELESLRQKCLPIPPILFAFIHHARRGELDKLAIDPKALDDIAMEAELALAHAADVLALREP